MDQNHVKEIAEYDPEKYISLQLYKNPEFSNITEGMMDRVIRNKSGLFFYYHFDNIPEFQKYLKRAAVFVASQNPLMAILVYGLNNREEFKNDVELAKILLISLVRESGGNWKDMSEASKTLSDPRIKASAMDLVELIAKKDSNFYRESGLAEDPEYSKFLIMLVEENNMSKYGDEVMFELAKLLEKQDTLTKTAAKKEKVEEEVEEEMEEKLPPKKMKSKKKKKAFSDILNNLVKLAEELDANGAKEAASLVDDALEILVANIKKAE